MGLTPPDLRPPGAKKSFIIRPGEIAKAEQLLLRELKIIEYLVKTRQIKKAEARIRGHDALENHYELVIEKVNEQVREEPDLPEADQSNLKLLEKLEQAKKDWDAIVTDLFTL